MGCDIHCWAEVRKNGKWEKVGKAFPNPWHDPEEHAKDPKDTFYEPLTDQPYEGRSYNTFAILANVRNGRGFAGCDTGDPFVPIAMPKGFPDDASPEVLKEYVYNVLDREPTEEEEDNEDLNLCSRDDAQKWVAQGYSTWVDEAKTRVTGPDWHSASWLTLAELEAYDWDQTTKLRGWVDPWNFEVWRTKGRPGSWSGGVSGNNIDHISNQQMARMIDEGEIQWAGDPPKEGSWSHRPYTTSLQRTMKGWPLPPGSVGAGMASHAVCNHYTQVEWPISYRDAARNFLEKTVPALRKLGKPEDVRIVFFFDN
jgi:hypothetical protein